VKPIRVLFAASLAVAASCSDSTGTSGLNGTLSFSHSGATSGNFNASGSAVVANPGTSEWAAAGRDDLDQSITIVANIPRGSNTADNVLVYFPQLTTGTVTIAQGSEVLIAFGINSSGTSATWSCELDAGSVVVTSVSNNRVQGSFSGTGDCFATTGGPVAFTVTNGSFNVPMLDIDDIP
jgi:hypothetical protein